MPDPQARGFFAIFLTFLRLGCVSFGGPVAHLGYYREAFVRRRQWLSDAAYTELIALCQSVPGPSSSQLGFAIGWLRGGPRGALAAWLGFTLPSALLMMAGAYGLLAYGATARALVDGLLAAAVAVVAHATIGLGRKMCPDLARLLLAAAAALIAYSLPGSLAQVLAIALGAGVGLFLFRSGHTTEAGTGLPGRISHRYSLPILIVFTGLLLTALFWPTQSPGALYAKHYEAGALVFGGGHVVLPLLADSVVATGLVPRADFLAGYSAAQIMPGPLFTLAAFNGTVAGGWSSGLLALAAIFMPGLLLIAALLPYWERFRKNHRARAALTGANAAVVGLLAAAFIYPVWAEGIGGPRDLIVAALAFVALRSGRVPVWAIVLACGASGLI